MSWYEGPFLHQDLAIEETMNAALYHLTLQDNVRPSVCEMKPKLESVMQKKDNHNKTKTDLPSLIKYKPVITASVMDICISAKVAVAINNISYSTV